MIKIDALGKRFNRWLVVSESSERSNSKQVLWLCRCDCGTEKLVVYNSLTNGYSRSCGCLKVEEFIERSKKHGKAGCKEYVCWQHMISRCYNRNNEKYYNYGARGISVCGRWLTSFDNFYSDMGDSPTKNHSLDRINVNGNYEPTNCRWATSKQQQSNRTNNNWLEYNGEKKILQDWVVELKTSHGNFIRMMKAKGVEKTIDYYKNIKTS